MRFGRKFRKIAWKIAVWVVESAVKRLLVSISVQIWEWLTKTVQNCVRNWAVLGCWESAYWASILLLSMSLYRSVWLRRFGQGWSSLFEGWRALTQWAKLTQSGPLEFWIWWCVCGSRWPRVTPLLVVSKVACSSKMKCPPIFGHKVKTIFCA